MTRWRTGSGAMGGWLRKLGALDFAGGTVVHISSGVSALAAALVIGKRRGYPQEPMPPHNLPLTVIGRRAALVRLVRVQRRQRARRRRARHERVRGHPLATAAAPWPGCSPSGSARGKPTVLGAASGAVAGLVAITPASGFVGPMPAIVIGRARGCSATRLHHEEEAGLR